MPDTLDIPLAIEQAGGSPELARDLLRMLLDELPGLYQKLQQAHAAGDAEARWDHAHKIYGSTAYCGVPALRDAAGALEKAIKAGADLQPALTALEQAVTDLLAAGPAALEQEWPTG